MERIAVYPGSFDPITNGHLDIIDRGLRIFDKIIVLIAHNPQKHTLFTVEERMAMIGDLVKDKERINVDSFTGLLVDYVREKEIACIVRGLRAMSDFEYEFQFALINRRLDRDIETVFLMTGFKWFYINSRIIKEAASFGGSVRGLVPDVVYRKLQEKYPKLKSIEEYDE
jgi:pantetheine-phosphate adenylyltransferase